MLLLPSLIVSTLSDYIWLPVFGSELVSNLATTTVMLLVALAAIMLLRRVTHIDFGLHFPLGRSYVATAIILGIVFGILMAVVDFGPGIVMHTTPHDYDNRLHNPASWILFESFYAAPTQEIAFRSFLVTWLSLSMPGEIRLGRFHMRGAGVIVATIFGVCFGLYALVAKPPFVALGEAVYVFVGSVALAYWLEKSRSVLAPIAGHSTALLIWQSLMLAMYPAWR